MCVCSRFERTSGLMEWTCSKEGQWVPVTKNSANASSAPVCSASKLHQFSTIYFLTFYSVIFNVLLINIEILLVSLQQCS